MRTYRTYVWIVLIVMGLLAYRSLDGLLIERNTEHLTFSDLNQILTTAPKTIKKLVFVNGSHEVKLERTDSKPPITISVPDKGGEYLVHKAAEANVHLEVQEASSSFLDFLASLIPNLIPTLLILGVLWYFTGRQQNQLNNVVKSGAIVIPPGKSGKTFADVAGCDEPKEELQEIVEYLKDPGALHRLGGRPPRGVLLVGAPGNGKTLLAKAVAGEAGVPFITMSASGFVEMFVGVGAARVRDVFELASKLSPCILFFDELDAIGRKRGAGHGGSHDEREQTLNELLVQMDGMSTDRGIILIAATNRADILDPALTRPGRFDRQVLVVAADQKGRAQILRVHARGKKLGSDCDLDTLASNTSGLSGAQLEASLNEAAVFAARRIEKAKRILKAQGKAQPEINAAVPEEITMDDAVEGATRVTQGIARTALDANMPAKEKMNTCVHEMGHYLLGTVLIGGDGASKVTAMSRGFSLGATYFTPKGDRYSYTREFLLARIIAAMAGRAAQEVLTGVVDTGASNDFEQGSQMARSMVTIYGMSKLGPISVSGEEKEPFLGRTMAVMSSGIGPDLANAIDREQSCIVNQCMAEAKSVIEQYREFLLMAAGILAVKGTMMDKELRELGSRYGIVPHSIDCEIECSVSPGKASGSKPAAPAALTGNQGSDSDRHGHCGGGCDDDLSEEHQDKPGDSPAEPKS